MNAKDFLALAGATVGYFMGMFGGGLTASEPPADPLHITQTFSAVQVNFTVLFILLLIWALVRFSRTRKARKIWIGVGVAGFLAFTVASLMYRSHWREHTVHALDLNPPRIIAVGTELTEAAQAVMRENPGLSKWELLSGFGGTDDITWVWTEASILRSVARFDYLYLLLVSGIAVAVFAVIEGALVPAEKGKKSPSA